MVLLELIAKLEEDSGGYLWVKRNGEGSDGGHGTSGKGGKGTSYSGGSAGGSAIRYKSDGHVVGGSRK